MRVPPLSLLQQVLRTAARADDAVAGSLQELSGGALRIVAHFNLPPEFVAHFATASGDDGSACGQALYERRRVVIRDMESDPGFAPHLAVARAAGLRAVQSTPFIDSAHRPLGVLSTYYAVPHHPPPHVLRTIDLCARVAAHLIEIHRLQKAIAGFDAQLGMIARRLSPTGAQAADAADVLLNDASRALDNDQIEAVDRHLGVVLAELGTLAGQFRRSQPAS